MNILIVRITITLNCILFLKLFCYKMKILNKTYSKQKNKHKDKN